MTPPQLSDHWDATNAVRLCEVCEHEMGVSAGADAGDRACSMCGRHEALTIYPGLSQFERVRAEVIAEVIAALTERDDDGQIVGGWSAADFIQRKFVEG